MLTVIIPVYCVENYLNEAVASALRQDDVSEIILIEDGSPDNSLAVCQKLAQSYRSVKVLQHPDCGNHGAGASRNLGIREATNEWIAFLDADDFYLDNRFETFFETIHSHPDADAVCEAVGVHFETDEDEKAWTRPRINTLERAFSPAELFRNQAPVGNRGFCCTPGWTVRKSALERVGMFPPHLRIHQDTALYVKLAAATTVYTGQLNAPVAMRRVHDANRITAVLNGPLNRRIHARAAFWHYLCRWGEGKLSKQDMKLIKERFFEDIQLIDRGEKSHWLLRCFAGLRNLLLLPMFYPRTLAVQQYYLHTFRSCLEVFWLGAKSILKHLMPSHPARHDG